MYALLKSPAEIRTHHHPVQIPDDVRVDEPALTHSLRRKLLNRHRQNFNRQEGGTRSPIKYLDRDSVEYSLTQAADNITSEARMARLTLYRSLALQDKVWGGIFQYATGDWHHPHYVMTMASQAGHLRLYALAHALWDNRIFKSAALQIRAYLCRFLASPVHAFYAGQLDRIRDCEPRSYYAMNELQRLRHGIPEIDTRILARENGWAIEALATCYEYCNDAAALELAVKAAHWIINQRSIADGGFKNGEETSYRLGDTLAMGRAFLQLYRATADADWLVRAINAADFIALHFHHRGGGFVPAVNTRGKLQTGPGIDENLSLMRFANLLSFYSGIKRHRGMAKHCFRFLCLDEVAAARDEETGILLADQEYNERPLQITVIGSRKDQRAGALYRAALNHYPWYKKLAWQDPGECPLQGREFYFKQQPVAVVRHPFSKSSHFYEAERLKDFLWSI